MNDRNINRLNMINACLTLAQEPAYRAVWEGKEPAAFAADFAELKLAVAETDKIAAAIGVAPVGAADAKAAAETALEDAAYAVVAGLRSFYRKTADVEGARKVDFAKSHLQRLRDAQLVADTRRIHAAATIAVMSTEANARGVTPEAVDALEAAIAAFDAWVSKPRTNTVTRNTLVRELATRVADHLEAIANLDDLVLQFRSAPGGPRFIEAWHGARVIVDAGASPAAPETPPAPAAAVAPGN